MRPRSIIMVCTILTSGWIGLAGCDRDDAPAVDAGSVKSATAPTTTAPDQARAPMTAPTASEISVGDAIYRFPPARLRIRRDDQGRFALLYSAKPAERKVARELDNSYYLQMDLGQAPMTGSEEESVAAAVATTTSADSLADASWHFKAPTSDPVDSPNGIFLD